MHVQPDTNSQLATCTIFVSKLLVPSVASDKKYILEVGKAFKKITMSLSLLSVVQNDTGSLVVCISLVKVGV